MVNLLEMMWMDDQELEKGSKTPGTSHFYQNPESQIEVRENTRSKIHTKFLYNPVPYNDIAPIRITIRFQAVTFIQIAEVGRPSSGHAVQVSFYNQLAYVAQAHVAPRVVVAV